LSVYFIQVGDDGPVKVGWSADPSKRLAQLQTSHPDKLYIRGVTIGSAFTERDIHARLAAHRLNGEWFQPHSDVFAEIATPYHDVTEVQTGLDLAGRLLSIAGNRLAAMDFDEARRMLEIVRDDITLALDMLPKGVPA
jgi:hypothetical protein